MELWRRSTSRNALRDIKLRERERDRERERERKKKKAGHIAYMQKYVAFLKGAELPLASRGTGVNDMQTQSNWGLEVGSARKS